jgi:hypothetical protein
MDTPRPYQKVALFLAALAVVFVAAAALGSLVEPAETEEKGTEGTAEARAAEHQPAGLGAFLHVHPEEEHEVAAEEIEFEASLPTAGRYRPYLRAGVVQTVEFTVVVPR